MPRAKAATNEAIDEGVFTKRNEDTVPDEAWYWTRRSRLGFGIDTMTTLYQKRNTLNTTQMSDVDRRMQAHNFARPIQKRTYNPIGWTAYNSR